MPFIGNLEYKKVSSGDLLNRPKYELTAPFSYTNDNVKPGFIVNCPVGMITDFASIPRIYFLLSPKNPKWKAASVIHDYACRMVRSSKPPLTYKDADNYLYYAMLDSGANKLVAYLFWWWVSLNHMIGI